MRATNTSKSMFMVTALACFALYASQAEAMGGHRPHRGVLAPSASPYALLSPIIISRDPNQGRAAFQGRPSSCPAGEEEISTDAGLGCRPVR
jgi:hypothetical protein